MIFKFITLYFSEESIGNIIMKNICFHLEETFIVKIKFFDLTIGLHDITRLILILYQLRLASIYKTIIDTIFIYIFRYNLKILLSRM